MSVKNAIHQKFMAIVTPYLKAPHKSTLNKNGKITPEEFVIAGDSLVAVCPNWSWAPSPDPKKAVDYLPADKQFLINRHVVCQDRAQDFLKLVDKEENVPEFDDWYQTGEAAKEEVVDLDDEEVIDLDDINIDEIEPEEIENKDAPVCRTYDITICYDNYYNTAHVYLYGVNPQGVQLTLEEMYQDISADHVEKTVTFENHPYFNQKTLSIHPCQHHNVILKLIERLENPESFCAPAFFFLFLKFIHTVIPTIDISTPQIEIGENRT
ncbi:autophagocytosis associated protein [Tritrichomonas foetus]|uniref:Autophagocytosis associated protein n=1 Tax=Tritrichomonas foetus TaxID=1144522 RepID=A0A1J4JPP2_9EUKA|nr:autophagocytosis associated protein [Tritrichomonas foetus]|eukprot:OHS99236.1 autophagocytosis associated protein [Tritrichomonas foetus]